MDYISYLSANCKITARPIKTSPNRVSLSHLKFLSSTAVLENVDKFQIFAHVRTYTFIIFHIKWFRITWNQEYCYFIMVWQPLSYKLSSRRSVQLQKDKMNKPFTVPYLKCLRSKHVIIWNQTPSSLYKENVQGRLWPLINALDWIFSDGNPCSDVLLAFSSILITNYVWNKKNVKTGLLNKE